MIQVIIQNNVERKTIVVPPDTTLEALIEQSGLNMSAGILQLDGVPVSGQTQKALREFSVGDTAYLIAVANKDNN